jgi:exodeoxyribonuclease V gamma subunit
MADVSIECKLSTDLNSMADQLARRLRVAQGKPFQKEIILVNGKAMSNWLTHYLVREADLGDGTKGLGVHANADLMNTQRFHSWVAGIIDKDASKGDPLESLELVVDKYLRNTPGEFAQFCGDITKDHGVVRWGASQRISSWLRELCLDDPDWVAQTEKGELKGPLEDLWRGIRNNLKGRTASDICRLLNDGKDAGTNRSAVADELPGRIFLFATGDVPRSLLRSLSALQAGGVTVEGFFLQPSQNYHADLDKEILAELKEREGQLQANQSPNEYELPKALLIDHPGANILSSAAPYFRSQFRKVMGTQGWDLGFDDVVDAEQVRPDSLLWRLKGAIDQFDIPAEALDEDAPQEHVSIHRCHGPVREAEVLRDAILDACSKDKHLRAKDILILTPDQDTYGAIVPAILSEAGISTVTVGISGAKQSPAGELAERLLSLPIGRCTAPELLELCESEAIRKRFGWEPDETANISKWLANAPFYWGSSGQHRAKMGLPAEQDAWTLRDLERRLILGTALPKGAGLSGEPSTLPFLGIEGKNDTELTADLLELIQASREWCDYALTPKPLQEWVGRFSETVKALLPTEYGFRESAAAMLGALGKMEAMAANADENPVPIQIFASFAIEQLDFDFAKGQFINGHAVLAPLKAGHIHPAKVIAFVGMADGTYPIRGLSPGPELRTNPKASAKKYREQQEEAGMHAFLLAICAADSRIICTYPGYVTGGKDASAALPVEILRRACHQLHKGFKETRHGLFSHEASLTIDPKVLKSTRDNLTTHDPIAAQVAAKLGEPKTKRKPGPDLPIDTTKLNLAQWVEFWGNPTKGVLSSLNIEVPYLKTELHSDEVLDNPYTHGLYAAKNWVEGFIKNTGREPTWEEAKLSGHFDTREEGHNHFNDTLKAADKTAEGEAGTADTTKWREGIKELFANEPLDHTSANALSIPVAFMSKGWLAVCCAKKLSGNGMAFLQGLALASALAHKGMVPKGIIFIEPDKVDAGTKEQTKASAQVLLFDSPKDATESFHKLNELAKKAVADTYVWGRKSTDALAWEGVSKKYGYTLDEECIEGGFRAGDRDERNVALVAPAAYNYEDASRAFLDAFATLGIKKVLRASAEFKTAFGLITKKK